MMVAALSFRILSCSLIRLPLTRLENRRLEYDVGIGYGDDIDLAKQLMLEATSVNGVSERSGSGRWWWNLRKVA